MADLRTDYQDDVLDASKNTARVYDLVDSNGTVVLAGVHLEDKTVYTTEGDDYGAADINEQNGKINELSNDLSDIQTYKVNKPNKRPINATNDMLNVAFGDNNAEVNQPFFFSTDAGSLASLPSDAPTPFYGWREVQCVMSLTTVVLHEMYPMHGRIWSNTYDTNQNNWLGWRAVQAPLEGKLVISKMYPVTFTNGAHSYTLSKPANYSVINAIPGAYVNSGYISDRHVIDQASTTCVVSCYSSAPTGSTGYINLIFVPSSIMTYA